MRCTLHNYSAYWRSEVPDVLLITVHAERGRIGKSLFANRLRDFYEDQGLTVAVIRIETRLAPPPQRPSDITVHVEDLLEARDHPGGAASAMGPLWDAIDSSRGIVIADWAAGTSDLRREIEASTGLSLALSAAGHSGISITVTTCDAGIMRQAAADLDWERQAQPEFERALVQNAVAGKFRAPRGTDQYSAYEELRSSAQGARVINVPLIGGAAWQPFRDAGISMRDALGEDVAKLSVQVGLNRWVVRACKAQLAAWWTATEEEVRLALRFPEGEDGLSGSRGDS